MNRADVTELHYITAIANLSSIMKHGILSYTLADQLAHDSVAMPEIQEGRRNKQIPGTGLLRILMHITRCSADAVAGITRSAFFESIQRFWTVLE